MEREEIFAYVRARYGTEPEYPWADDPRSAVLRHAANRKWYALLIEAPRARLNLAGEGVSPLVNVKCDPLLAGSLRAQPGVLPAYHMNKEHWLSLLLDGPLPKAEILRLLDWSYALTKPK